MAIEAKEFEQNESRERKAKRPYRAPELEIHGKVDKLTLATGDPIDGGGLAGAGFFK